MSTKMALRRFALGAVAGYRGRDASEAFARDLIACFGTPDQEHEPPSFSYAFPIVEEGKRVNRTVSAYWPTRRVLVDVVERDMMLDVAWNELLRACLQMNSKPQYVVLTNQRDVRLYDLAKDRSTPRLSIALDEIPKYSEAFVFFERDWTPGSTPKIVNVDKVSKEVAELLARVYRALKAHNPDRGEEVIQFTLQCIVAMFAEDVGLLPNDYFSTLLYRAAEEGDAEEKIGALFRAMSSSAPNDAGIPFFNGGLFHDPMNLTLGEGSLRALTKAAEANWTFVDPHIFGSVFQGTMDDAERHAQGVQYTAREDIMSVVGPTIVEPWRERITAASTLNELREILSDFSQYRVLDPACGSGNFLYVAFLELYRLETEALCRIFEFASAQKGKISWASGIRTTNFFGIDINPFAVELAKTTLNIAKKIAFEERKATVMELYSQGFLEVDPSLPLDNLDGNIICGDALFTEWPAVDAIIGNPPFLGAKKFLDELGEPYVKKLRAAYSEVPGKADLCAFWFRRAHDLLGPRSRAGLIATNTIRNGATAQAATRYIVKHGGEIINAISNQPWSGESTQSVSVVNWTKGHYQGCRTLTVGNRIYRPPKIGPHLQIGAGVDEAMKLSSNHEGSVEGINFGTTAFFLQPSALNKILADSTSRWVIRPTANGAAVLSGRFFIDPEYALFFPGECACEQSASQSRAAYAYLKEKVYPVVAEKASRGRSYSGWLRQWWSPWHTRTNFFSATRNHRRIVACSQTMARPIYFLLSTKILPTNSLQLFAFEDDYTFGILQSAVHWAWTQAMGGRMEERIRYRSKVWSTFPWPQQPTESDVIAVAKVARELRATRDRLMADNGWSLRALYQSAEVAGSHPLKDAQAALDQAVEAAYGKPPQQEATEFLLELNLCLAEDEAAGESIQGPGLPAGLDPQDTRWFSTDCIEPLPLDLESPGETARG